MASFRFYLLSAVICSVLVIGQTLTTPPTQIIDVTKAETTAAPETTLKPDTTTESTSTTTPSTTTTTTPSTTTTSTTTTTTSTTTTTPSTTTSTTTPVPPAPTPAPPKPAPGPLETGTWYYADKNVTCIVVQFAAQLNVTYTVLVNSSTFDQQLNVPANASVVSGWCGNTTQSLTLTWPATTDKNNTLAIVFKKNDTTNSYELNTLNVTLVPSMSTNNSAPIEFYHGVEWPTPLATSYRCAAPTKLMLTTAEPASVAATLTLSHLQEEAFRTAEGKGFSAPRDCAGGDIPDAVPIAVGCALGGMVVVVLIAYLVARRRSAARGYLSM